MGNLRAATATDVPRINSVLNHPSCRPWVFQGTDPIDFTHNIGVTPAYVTDGGVLFAEALGFGDYVSVSAFRPEERGLPASIAHRLAMDHFFSTTDCLRLFAICGSNNPAAFRNLVGMGFRLDDTEGPDRLIYVIDWIGWAKGSRAAMRAARCYVDAGWVTDPAEAMVLGAFCMTYRGGWKGKAIAGFNRWALLSGRESISPVGEETDLFLFKGKHLLNPHRFLTGEVTNE